MPEALFGKRWASVLSQQFHEAHDMAQRRPQIVGDGVAERLQLSVRRFQFGGTLSDAPFQFRIQPPDFLLRLLTIGDVGD